ncbi:MAG: AMP-binding protein [Bacteroidales bacterium]|nr:AMP-binding protein [Bacteroidales bacterium]
MIKLIERSDKDAIIGENIRYTYDSVLKNIGAYSDQLGETDGQNVVIFSENRVEWIFALYASWKNNASVIPIDTLSTQEEVEYIISDCRPRVIFCSRDKSGVIHNAVRNTGQNPDVLIFEDLMMHAEHFAPEDFVIADEEKTALILYTSGTTGNPKGVMLSYQNLLTNLTAVCQDVPIYTQVDRVMILLPLHHILPLVGTIVAPFYAKGTIVMNTSFSAENLIGVLQQFKVTIMIGVPRLYQLIYKGLREKIRQNAAARVMLWLSRRVHSISFSRKLFGTVHKKFGGAIKYLVSGGAPIDPEIVRFFVDLGFELLEGYGMTETAPMITFTRPGKIKPGIPGQLLPGIRIRFSDDEILVSGSNVMKGYYNKPEETAEVLKDGWLHTGDLGFMDQEGYVHITGRKKEIIVLPNGKNINPEEVERVIIRQSPLVKETGVFLKDGVLQSIIVPDFKKLNEAGIKDLNDHVRWNIIDQANRSLSAYKKIIRFHITAEELPKTRLGKIKRYQLPDMVKEREKTTENEPEIWEYQVLKKFLEEETQNSVHPADHLELDLAIDSLGKVSLSAFIETAFGIEISENTLSDFQSVSKLAEYLHAKKTRLGNESISWSQILREKVHLNLEKPVFPHTLINSFIKLILRSFMRIKAKGLENLPDYPCIIAPNHQSILDGFLVVSLFKRKFMNRTYVYAKEKHFRNPVLKYLAGKNNVILVDVNKDLKRSIQKLAEVLKKGKNLVIFPEGTRTLTGKLGDFKQTFAILSQELNIPVVPVAIRGSYNVLPAGARIPRLFKKVTVDILQPVNPENHTYDSLKHLVYSKLATYLEE